MWSVYILLCQDGSFYIGSSNDVRKRFLIHKNGKGGRYTRSHKPIQVVYQEDYSTKSQALKREAHLKTLTHAQKQALKELSDRG